MSQDVKVYRSFKFFGKLTVFELLSIALFIFFVYVGIEEIIKYNNPFIGVPLTILGGFLGLFFLPFLSFSVKMLFTFAPILIVTNEGIIDNTTVFRFGLIRWNEIESINEMETGTEELIFSYELKSLFIKVVDNETFLQRSNPIYRKILLWRLHTNDSLIHIPLKNLAQKNKLQALNKIAYHMQNSKMKGDL